MPMADLGDVQIGSTVTIAVMVGPDENVAAEHNGVVSDMVAAPATIDTPAGTVYGSLIAFTSVDRVVELAEDDDAAEAGYAFSGSLRTRIVNLLTAHPSITTVTAPNPVVAVSQTALAGSNDSTLALVSKWLDEWPIYLEPAGPGDWLGVHGEFALGVLTFDGSEATIHAVEREDVGSRYPGTLEADGSVTWSADTPGGRAWLGRACVDVDVATRWKRTKRGFPNRWVAKSVNGGLRAYVETGDRPVVAVVRETNLNGADYNAMLVNAMRPPLVDPSGWANEGLTLWLHDDSELINPGLPFIPTHENAGEVLAAVLTVVDIPVTQTPSPGAVYAGRLTRSVVRVAGGQVSVEVKLAPEFPRQPYSTAGPTLSFNNLTADLPSLAIEDVDPTLTIDLARLLTT